MVKFKIFGCNPWRFNLWHGSRRANLCEKRERKKRLQSIECRALACRFWQLLTASDSFTSFTYCDLVSEWNIMPRYAKHAAARGNELHFLFPLPDRELTKCCKHTKKHLLLWHFLGEAKLLSLEQEQVRTSFSICQSQRKGTGIDPIKKIIKHIHYAWLHL